MTGKKGDTANREAAAQASLAALDSSHAECVNLTFTDVEPTSGLLPYRPVLTLDAPRVSGVAGARKPVITEMLDVLAADAAARRIPRLGLVNGDIIVLPEAIERIASIDRPAIAVSRTDVGGDAAEGPLLYGVDMVVFDLAFWRKERRRFRAYLLGEAVWDNVYASIIVCHGGTLLNRERLILHERHPPAFRGTPFERYVHLLAARDRTYFSLWCRYVARAEALRAGGGSADDEFALQREVFEPPGVTAEMMDLGRAAWWRAKRKLGA